MKERNLRRTEATETDTLKTKRVKIPRAKSHLEEAFWLQLRVENLQGEFKREFRFCSHRKWRFDFANEFYRLGIEIEGGIWKFGHHNRGKGFEDDCEKYNHAALDDWTVFRFTPKMVNNLDGLELVKAYIKRHGG